MNNIQKLDVTIVDWNEEADARFVSSTLVLQNESFHKLWCDEYVLAMPKDHPLKPQQIPTIDKFKDCIEGVI